MILKRDMSDVVGKVLKGRFFYYYSYYSLKTIRG